MSPGDAVAAEEEEGTGICVAVVFVVGVVVEEDRGVDDDDMRSAAKAADADCVTLALVSITQISPPVLDHSLDIQMCQSTFLGSS